jgi:queuine tRNA-ribosyltransferase
MRIFDIHTRSTKSKARTGTVKLSRGEIKTPCFMSIGTAGSVKSLTTDDLRRLEAPIILGNTYHLWLRPGLETMQRAGGLHSFIHWDQPILTDSGGFQAFSLSKIRSFSDEGVFFQSQIDGRTRFLSPEISMGIQTILGSDIALQLDECLEAEVSKTKAQHALDRTIDWAKRCQTEFNRLKETPPTAEQINALEEFQLNYAQQKSRLHKRKHQSKRNALKYQEFLEHNQFVLNYPQLTEHTPEVKRESDSNSAPYSQNYKRHLFGIPQGAQFPDLRKQAAERIMELDFPGYSIGGVANGGEPEEMMYAQVLAQTEILEDHKPRHLLGVGTPKDIIEMVKRGIDMFDCVYPTRNARHGSIIVWTDKSTLGYETLKIQGTRFEHDFSPINANSKLPELRNYTKAYLRHLFKAGELLGFRLATLQNLEFYYDLMEELRNRIDRGEL